MRDEVVSWWISECRKAFKETGQEVGCENVIVCESYSGGSVFLLFSGSSHRYTAPQPHPCPRRPASEKAEVSSL